VICPTVPGYLPLQLFDPGSAGWRGSGANPSRSWESSRRASRIWEGFPAGQGAPRLSPAQADSLSVRIIDHTPRRAAPMIAGLASLLLPRDLVQPVQPCSNTNVLRAEEFAPWTMALNLQRVQEQIPVMALHRTCSNRWIKQRSWGWRP
jgi:hypothetical protein